MPACFHLDSRDIYLKGDIEKMKEFYRSQVVLTDPKEAQYQVDSGVCLRITEPSTIILNKYPHKTTTQNVNPSVFHCTPNTTTTQESPKNEIKDGPPSTLNTLSLEKMWLISSLVGQYLNEDFYSGSLKNDNKK